jgi:hypothetical protein
MKPSEVPGELVDAFRRAAEIAADYDPEGAFRQILAAVLPTHEAMVREQVTAEVYVAEAIWFEENPVDGRTRVAVCATLDGALDALREHHIFGGDLVATEAERSALGTATARTWAVHERGSHPDDEGCLWITGEPMAFAAKVARGGTG